MLFWLQWYGFTILVVFALASASGLLARDGFADPIFATIPFDQWLEQKQQTPIHWTVHISDPALSAHQRLGVILDVRVDGAELARRRGEGKLLVLAQITDGKNRTWQNHVETDLAHIEEGIRRNNVIFSQSFFVVPGDYRAAVAIFDTASGEHNIIKRTLHVAPFRNDPLPDLWRDLPAVEFFTPEPTGSLVSPVSRRETASACRNPPSDASQPGGESDARGTVCDFFPRSESQSWRRCCHRPRSCPKWIGKCEVQY